MITKLNKMRTAILANALAIALSCLILVAPWRCLNALSAENSAPSEATASRIKPK